MTAHSPTNEWNELEAAQRSEAELRRIMWEGAPGASRRELEAVKRDALRAMVVGLPDPAEVARTLETAHPEAAETLRQAWISKRQPYAGSWRIAEDAHAPLLRSLGLVGWVSKHDGCGVGNFGMKVRRFLLAEDDEGDA